MKKIIAIVLLSFIVFSCGKKENNINVSIEGVPDGRKVVLKKQVDNEIIPIDSTTVQGGKFGFNVEIKEPIILGMFIDSLKQGIYPMIDVNDKIDVIAYKDSLHNSDIKGSKLYDELKALRDMRTGLMKEINAYNSQYFAAHQANDTAKMNEIRRKGKEIGDQISLNEWNYIRNNPDSHVSAMALQNLFMNPAYQDSLKMAFYDLSEEVQNAEVSKRLRDYFEKQTPINPNINTKVVKKKEE